MPRNITVKFADGSTHVYQNAPDDVTPELITVRATKDFGKRIVHLDGGRNAAATDFAGADLLNTNPFAAPTTQLQRPNTPLFAPPETTYNPEQLGREGDLELDQSRDTTLMDRVQAIPGVRAVGGAVRTAYGAGQIASEVVGSVAERFGLDRALTDQLRDEFTRRIQTLDEEANRGLTNARNPADLAGGLLPERWQESYQNTNVAGMVGSAAPFAVMPAVGATRAGVLGVAERAASNAAIGAGAGYFAPQTGEVSLDQAKSNAGWGAALGGGGSLAIEGAVGSINYLRHLFGDATARALANAVGPENIDRVAAEIHAHQQSTPGYAPDAAEAAVNAEVSNLAGLRNAAAKVLPDEYAQRAAARSLAQTEQADRLAAMRVDDATTPAPGVTARAAPRYEPPPEVLVEGVQTRLAARSQGIAGQLDDVKAQAVQAAEERATSLKAAEEANARRALWAAEGDRGTRANLATESEQTRYGQLRAQTQAERQVRDLPPTTPPVTLEAAQAELAAQREAADRAAREVAQGIPEAEQSDVGARILGAHTAMERAVQQHVIAPKYAAALEMAGDLKTDLKATRAARERVLGAAQTVITPANAPRTIDRLGNLGRDLGPDGEPVETGLATLEDIDAAIHAINDDLYAAGRSGDQVVQRNLFQLRDALQRDLDESTVFSDGVKRAYAEAQQTFATEKAPRFRTGLGNAMRLRTSNNTSRIPPSTLVDTILQRGGKTDNAQQFVVSVRNTPAVLESEGAEAAEQASMQAIAALREGIEDKFRRSVLNPVTGRVDINAAIKFLTRDKTGYGRQLDILEQVSPGLRASLERYTDAARSAQVTLDRLNRAAQELPARVRAETRVAQRDAQQQAQRELDRVRDELARQRHLRNLDQGQLSQQLGQARAETKSALAARLDQDRAAIGAKFQAAQEAAAAEQARIAQELKAANEEAQALNFGDGEQMFKRTLNDGRARRTVLSALNPTERTSLARRLEWEISRKDKPEARLAFMSAKEKAILEIFRADNPHTATGRLGDLRSQAEQAWREAERSRVAAGASSSASPQAVADKRLAAARRQIGDVPAEGPFREAYEAQKAELTRNLPARDREAIADLELDIERERRVAAQAARAQQDYRSILNIHTQSMENHGVLPGMLNTTVAVVRWLQRRVGNRMNKAAQQKLARLLLNPEETVSAMQRGRDILQSDQAFSQTARTAGNAAMRGVINTQGQEQP